MKTVFLVTAIVLCVFAAFGFSPIAALSLFPLGVAFLAAAFLPGVS